MPGAESIVLDGPAGASSTTSHREVMGRLLVGLLALSGLAIAAPSAFSLLWFVPFAGVGSLLAVRRPRTSIGWLLLALGWAHTLAALDPGAVLPIGLSAAQIARAAWPVVFFLYALLAIVLPSGRLPRGRWGRASRGLLVVVAACVVINALVPAAADALVLPLVVILLVSVGSLVARTFRATGIERQQLRWIGASLALVVTAVVAGLVISTLVPASATGIAWLPAALSFPAVPIAIGIAVLRYRLYEIDTIINRAIVYGLLTAILAGGSAALIGIAERLFEGVIGPGSDATIVLTTLLVVAAFTPVKQRLQTMVDRQFKGAPNPDIVLAAFAVELRDAPSELSVDRTLRRFLKVAIGAFSVIGGEVSISDGKSPDRSVFAGNPTGTTALEATASSGELRVAMRLVGVVPSRGAAALAPALAAVLDELTGPEQPDAPKS